MPSLSILLTKMWKQVRPQRQGQYHFYFIFLITYKKHQIISLSMLIINIYSTVRTE